MTRIWQSTRPVYYGNTAERDGFDETGETPGALFFDYDDERLYQIGGTVIQTLDMALIAEDFTLLVAEDFSILYEV